MSNKLYVLMISLIICINYATGAQENPAEDLFAAAAAGDLEQAKNILLQHPEVVQSADEQQSTPLHWAAARDFPALAQILIAHGADIDAEDRHEATPLHLAAAQGNLSLVRLLLGHSADKHARTVDRETLLHKAARSHSPALICFLTAMLAQNDINTKTVFGDTALHLAAAAGDLESVKILLENGADIDAKNNRKHTAVYRAVDYGFEPIVRHLIRSGIQLDEVAIRLIRSRMPHYNWQQDRQEYDIQRQQKLVEKEPRLPDVLGEIIAALAD